MTKYPTMTKRQPIINAARNDMFSALLEIELKYELDYIETLKLLIEYQSQILKHVTKLQHERRIS